MVISFYYSFTHYDLTSSPHWIGLDNYRFMFGKLTIDGARPGRPDVLAGGQKHGVDHRVRVPLRVVFAMGTAMLLTRPRRGVNGYRTLFFMPSLAPTVGATLVFVYLFNPTTGPINTFLDHPRDLGAAVVHRPDWAKPALVMLGLWGAGDAIILYLAGLLNVPRELYEAITVEGASAWQRFKHVTLPMITPVILFTVITGMIDSFQYFDQAYVASTTAGSRWRPPGLADVLRRVALPAGVHLLPHGLCLGPGLGAVCGHDGVHGDPAVTSRRWVHYGGGLS